MLNRCRSVTSTHLLLLTVTALVLGGCVDSASQQGPTVTKTVQERVTITATPAPEYGLMDPAVETLLVDICVYIEGNEPRWSDLQEAGPYDGFPADVSRIRTLAVRANETYKWIFERLDYGVQAAVGNVIYGSIYTDIANRANLAIALQSAADSYLQTERDYDRLFFMWAAYTGSIESQVSGCSSLT